jgi:hypothetical protein
MKDPYIISSATDLRKRVCCVLQDRLYYIALSLLTSSKQFVPIHCLDEGPGNYVVPDNSNAVVYHILEGGPHIFLQLAYIHNHIKGTIVTRECAATWQAYPPLLKSFGLLYSVNDIKMDPVIRNVADGSYDPESLTFQYYIQGARHHFLQARGADTFVPPPLDMVDPEADIKAKVCALRDDYLEMFNNDSDSDDDNFYMRRCEEYLRRNNPKTPTSKTQTNRIRCVTESTASLVLTLDTSFGLPTPPLRKIKNKDGNVRYGSGHYAKKSCYICRGWYHKPPTTSFECSNCGMPLCNPNTTGVREGRSDSCLFEHNNSTHDETKCGGLYYPNKKFPSELKRVPLLNLASTKQSSVKKVVETSPKEDSELI